MIVLSHRKKILVSLPDSLLNEVDTLAAKQKLDRSEFIREAARNYVAQQKNASYKEKLKEGYQSMAEINIEIAELCLEADNIQQQSYEEKLAECE
jgi:CopG family transcriptional regulator/antitoxin EndoAI